MVGLGSVPLILPKTPTKETGLLPAPGPHRSLLSLLHHGGELCGVFFRHYLSHP